MNNKIDPLNRREEAILLLDNYDSFTYNLLHVVKELGATNIEVFRNDEISLEEVERFDKIILRRDRAYRKKPDCCYPLSGNMHRPKHLRSLPGTSGHR